MTNEATGLLRFTSHSDEVLSAIKHNAQFSLAIIGVGLIGGSLGLALKDRLGEKVYFSEGSALNMKINTMEDVEMFRALYKMKHPEEQTEGR